MSNSEQQPGESDRALRALAVRKSKARNKWVSFKKALRTNKRLHPDVAEKTFGAEKAKYDREMRWINEQREKSLSKTVGRI